MAREIRVFDCLIPAGTLQTAPITIDLAMPVRVVTEIEFVIPPGPNGLVGFALGSAGVNIIPIQKGVWIIGNDEIARWPVTEQIDSGAWQFFGYNTGTFAHTITVRFLLDLVANKGLSPLTLIPNEAITSNMGVLPIPAIVSG